MLALRIGWIVSWVLMPSFALAWDHHQELMPHLLRSIPSVAKQDSTLTAPCDVKNRYRRLAQELSLNPDVPLPEKDLFGEACTKKQALSAREILLSPAVDEPDMGMDENLPDSFDPERERKWMGGSKGPTSKGFRHMFFGGWKFRHPIRTMQIPPNAIGKAPDRAALLARKAKELLQEGDRAWGYRVLGWALHYIQDLAQPFHSTQVVTPKMIPWGELLSFSLSRFISESTRIVANYHWAYEQLTLTRLDSFSPCLEELEKFATVQLEAPIEPLELAHAIAKASVKLASPVGKAEMRLFGDSLKEPGVDLPRGKGTPDYQAYATRDELDSVSCQALANAAVGSRKLIQWALTP